MKRTFSILSVAIAIASLAFFTVFPHHHHDDGRICLVTEYGCEHADLPHADDCEEHKGSCASSMDYVEPQTDGGLKCKICSCANPLHEHLSFVAVGTPNCMLLADGGPVVRLPGFFLSFYYFSDASFVYGLRAPPLYS
ncbi:MAG: hypothetical protein LBD28_03080 [Tannerellaceae bacterium]|nr:hypothetical protein [Tannerellaceae bacterium]